MASTFSNLGLNLQGTGDNAGTWGAITNVNLQDIDNAIAGVITVTVTGNTTLAFTTNSTSTTYTDEAGRNKTIILSGALSATTVTITVPNIEKDYYIINNSGATTVISSGGSTTVSIATGSKNIVVVNPSVTSVISALPTDQVNSPGGTTNAVQYNSAGSFAGNTNFTYDGTTATILNAVFSSTANLTTRSELRFQDAAGGEYIGLRSSTTISASYTLNLPTADATTSGQALTSDASGNLSFATVLTPTSTSTLTNKRIDPRVVSTTSSTSVTPDISVADVYAFTALSTTLVIATPTGTPLDGNKLIFRVLDNGTTRTLTWSSTYTAIGVTLPTATTANKITYVGCIYNTANTRWDAIAVTTQA